PPIDVISALSVAGRRQVAFAPCWPTRCSRLMAEPPPRLAVEEVGAACVVACLVAAAELHEARGGDPVAVAVDARLCRGSLLSERLFRPRGDPPAMGSAPHPRSVPRARGSGRPR